MTVSDFYNEFKSEHGEMPTTPVEALKHVVSIFADEADDVMVVLATRNIYGKGVATGLTWGDLRAILKEIEGS